MRWGDSLTLKFVKMYLKHNCLWNPEHPAYKNKIDRDKAYFAISSEFEALSGYNMTVPEIKVKIKNLRTTYSQQVHKILQKSSPDAMYEPSLLWFHEMDKCLKNVPMSVRQSIVTKYQQQADADSTQVWVDLETQKNFEEPNPDPLIPEADASYLLIEPEDLIKQERRTSFKKIKKKKFKHNKSLCFISNSNTERGEDEFDIYGKFIASQLRQMDLQKALRLQVGIQSLVSEARISDLT